MKQNRTCLFRSWVRVAVLCAALFSFSSPRGIAVEESVTTSVKGGLFPPSSWVGEKTYLDKVTHKLGVGIQNISIGWMALLYEPVRGKYFFDGVVKGLFYTFTNTAGGILQAATFPAPVDIPLLHGGINYEYPHQ